MNRTYQFVKCPAGIDLKDAVRDAMMFQLRKEPFRAEYAAMIKCIKYHCIVRSDSIPPGVYQRMELSRNAVDALSEKGLMAVGLVTPCSSDNGKQRVVYFVGFVHRTSDAIQYARLCRASDMSYQSQDTGKCPAEDVYVLSIGDLTVSFRDVYDRMTASESSMRFVPEGSSFDGAHEVPVMTGGHSGRDSSTGGASAIQDESYEDMEDIHYVRMLPVQPPAMETVVYTIVNMYIERRLESMYRLYSGMMGLNNNACVSMLEENHTQTPTDQSAMYIIAIACTCSVDAQEFFATTYARLCGELWSSLGLAVAKRMSFRMNALVMDTTPRAPSLNHQMREAARARAVDVMNYVDEKLGLRRDMESGLNALDDPLRSIVRKVHGNIEQFLKNERSKSEEFEKMMQSVSIDDCAE